MTKQDFIHVIPMLKKINVVFSHITKMPMVFCSDETADDYVYVYMEEASALEKAKELNENKQPALGVSVNDKDILPFFAELRFAGVNAVCFVTPKEDGAEEFMVQLTEFINYPNLSELPEAARPVENPALHLSMLYFMQEVRRPMEMSEKKNLNELEEETSANMVRSRFLVPIQEMDGENEEEKKRAVMLLKNERGDIFFPLFTDGAELRKFMRDQRTPVMVGDFKSIAELLQKGNATGIAINPASSNVVLNKLGVASLIQRFLQ